MSWIDRGLASGGVTRRVVDELLEPTPEREEGAIAEVIAAPLRGMLTLRADLASEAAAAAVEAATGLGIPAARRFEAAADRGVYWMSPDELLLTTPYETVGEAYAKASAALKGAHHLVVDVSDARQVFVVRGAAARDVLAKCAPVDLHPSKFGQGDLRRTRMADVAAMIAQIDEGPDVFEAFCFRSYAAYLHRLLRQAAAQGGEVGLYAAKT